MVTTLIRRGVPLVALVCLSVFIVQLNPVPGERSDLWFHLRLGSEFLDGWSLSSPGHLGVYDHASWRPTQWLSQIGMAAAERSGGLASVLAMSAVLQAATLGVTYIACRRVASPLASTVSCVVVLFSLAAAFTPRPQIVSYLLFALTVAAWRRAAATGCAPLWLVPLTWLWVPLHGMWPIAVVLGAVMALGLALDEVGDRQQRLRMWAVPACSLLVACVTPLGFAIFHAVLEVGDRRAYFAEWAAPDFTDVRATGVLLMTAVVLISVLRRGPLAWTPVLYLGVAIALAVFSFRTLPLAAIMLAPLFAQAMQNNLPDSEPPGRAERLIVALAAPAVGLAVLLATPAATNGPPIAPWLADRLAVMPEGTRVLDEWDTGGYFLWKAPHVDLVMHGYADVFTVDELRRNVELSRVDAGWDATVDDLDVDYALVDPESALGYALTEHASWQVVEGDDSYVLLRAPGHEG